MKKFVFVILILFMAPLLADSHVVNVYNWTGYIPDTVLKLFTNETGIKVNYSTFDSNEQLYTKLKADPNIDYDIVVPSSYVVARMAKEGMLRKLDKSKLSNIKNLEPPLLNRSYDPGNQFSLPYMWGTASLIINTKYYSPAMITSWNDLWRPRFREQIAMTNSARDVFAIAFLRLGYSINDENPKHIREAYFELKKLLPNIISFADEGSQQLFVNEDVNIGMIENGEAMSVIRENPSFKYVYLKEGPIIWIDNMVIPKGAKHVGDAYRFINFILRPDIAKMISVGVGFSSPNRAAKKLLPEQVKNNPILYPPAAILEKGQVESAISNKANALYLHYWELLKLEG